MIKKIWSWMTQFSHAYAIATILVVVVCLSLNGMNDAIVILEPNTLIRRLEIGSGIVSLVIMIINFFGKFGDMAEGKW